MRAAWMLGRSVWRRRLASLLLLGLLAGLIGVAVLAPIAGMRRSATAFDRLVARTQSPQAVVFQNGNYPAVEGQLRALPDVDTVERIVNLTGRLDPTQDWYSLYAPTRATRADLVVARGRQADPARPDEVVISERTSSGTGLDVGDRLRFRAYTQTQFEDIFGNSWTPPDGPLISVRVVGVIRDRTDALQSSTVKLVIGTPAFARKYASAETYRTYNVWLRNGPDGVSRFEQNASRLLALSFQP